MTRLFLDTWRVILIGWRIFVPLLLFRVAAWLIPFLSDSIFGGSPAIWRWVVAILVDIVGGLGGWLTVVAMIVAADSLSERQSMSVSAAYATAMRRFWPYLVTVVFVGLIGLEGGILLIVPGILLTLTLYTAIYAAVVEELRPREALARSCFLTTGHRGQIFFRVLVFKIFCTILFWIPFIAVFGRPNALWIELPPVDGYVSGVDLPEPAWFPYVAGPGEALWVLLFGVFMVLLFKSLRAESGDGTRRVPLWPAAVFVVIGLMVTLYSGSNFVQTKSFLARAAPAVGTLVAPSATTYASGVVTLGWAAAFEFATPDGVKHRAQTMLTQTGITDLPLGSRVRVLYDPGDPENARFDSWFLIWGVFAATSILGVGMLLIGLAQWAYLRRNVAAVLPSSGQQTGIAH